MSDEPTLELGPCCVCRRTGPPVRNPVMLHRKCPIPGRGWGCLACGLPADGAQAVVCDACLGPLDPRTGMPVTDVTPRLLDACRGYPAEDGRVPIAELVGEHDHDPAGHPELVDDAGDWPDGWEDDDGLDEDEREAERCTIQGCRRRGTVILFRGQGDDDPAMTIARFCLEHLEALYEFRDGMLRPRDGVDAAGLVPRPPSLDRN